MCKDINSSLLTCLALLAELQYVFSGLVEAPPKINGFFPTKIGQTQTYNAHLNLDFTPNIIRCVVENADKIKWLYHRESTETMSETLPDGMVIEPLSRTETTITGEVRQADKARDVDGYYQCIAINSLDPVFVSLSPYIHLRRVGLNDYSATPFQPIYARNSTSSPPTDGKPYVLPCFKDRTRWPDANYIIPSDPHIYPETSIDYSWEKRIGINTIWLKDDPHLKVNPYTGNLYFTTLRKDDELVPTRSDSLRVYICKVTAVDSMGIAVNRAYLKVDNAVQDDAGSDQVSVLYPTTAQEREVICFEFKRCQVPCIFGGRQAVLGRLEVVQPGSSQAKVVMQPQYGFYFIGDKTQSGTWVCRLVSPENNRTVLAEARVNIKVHNYPKISSRDHFKDTFVRVGSNVKLICTVTDLGSDQAQFFWVNGTKYTSGSRRNMHLTSPSQLDLTNLQREDSASISCSARNNLATMFETISLNVYSMPTLKQTPRAGHIAMKDRSSIDQWRDLYVFSCEFTMDSKVDPDGVKMHFTSTRAGMQHQKITEPDSYGVEYVTAIIMDAGKRIYKISLGLKLTKLTFEYINETEWTCVAEFSLLNKAYSDTDRSSPMTFQVAPHCILEDSRFLNGYIADKNSRPLPGILPGKSGYLVCNSGYTTSVNDNSYTCTKSLLLIGRAVCKKSAAAVVLIIFPVLFLPLASGLLYLFYRKRQQKVTNEEIVTDMDRRKTINAGPVGWGEGEAADGLMNSDGAGEERGSEPLYSVPIKPEQGKKAQQSKTKHRSKSDAGRLVKRVSIAENKNVTKDIKPVEAYESATNVDLLAAGAADEPAIAHGLKKTGSKTKKGSRGSIGAPQQPSAVDDQILEEPILGAQKGIDLESSGKNTVAGSLEEKGGLLSFLGVRKPSVKGEAVSLSEIPGLVTGRSSVKEGSNDLDRSKPSNDEDAKEAGLTSISKKPSASKSKKGSAADIPGLGRKGSTQHGGGKNTLKDSGGDDEAGLLSLLKKKGSISKSKQGSTAEMPSLGSTAAGKSGGAKNTVKEAKGTDEVGKLSNVTKKPAANPKQIAEPEDDSKNKPLSFSGWQASRPAVGPEKKRSLGGGSKASVDRKQSLDQPLLGKTGKDTKPADPIEKSAGNPLDGTKQIGKTGSASAAAKQRKLVV